MVVVLLLIAAIVLHQLRNMSVTTLLAMLLMMLSVGMWYWLTLKDMKPLGVNKLVSDLKGRQEMVTPTYEIKKSRGDLKYLLQNSDFQVIANNLRFTRIFDKGRFGDLLVHMDKLHKVYMYILAGRYNPEKYIATFKDLREATLEILSRFFMVIPQNLKHTYGLDPYAELYSNIGMLNVATRTMLNVLLGYSKGNGYNVVDDYLQPYQNSRKHVLP